MPAQRVKKISYKYKRQFISMYMCVYIYVHKYMTSKEVIVAHDGELTYKQS